MEFFLEEPIIYVFLNIFGTLAELLSFLILIFYPFEHCSGNGVRCLFYPRDPG
jgi:hypothetical protein